LIGEGQERGEIATARTGNPKQQVSTVTTLEQIGLTRDESSQFAKLAKIDEEDFLCRSLKVRPLPINRLLIY
jgi:hypothetical protein